MSRTAKSVMTADALFNLRDDGKRHLDHSEHTLGDRGRNRIVRACAEREGFVPFVGQAIQE